MNRNVNKEIHYFGESCLNVKGGRKGGDIGLFITLVPKGTFSDSLTLQLGDFSEF